MYCWGSTVYGESGLGGIEEENILVPREVDFQKANQVVQSMKFFLKLQFTLFLKMF